MTTIASASISFVFSIFKLFFLIPLSAVYIFLGAKIFKQKFNYIEALALAAIVEITIIAFRWILTPIPFAKLFPWGSFLLNVFLDLHYIIAFIVGIIALRYYFKLRWIKAFFISLTWVVFRLIMLFLVVILLSGLYLGLIAWAWSPDYTSLPPDDPHWGGYAYNQEYVLQEDIFLLRTFNPCCEKNKNSVAAFIDSIFCNCDEDFSLAPAAILKNENLTNLTIDSYKKGVNDIIFEYNDIKKMVLGIVRQGTRIKTTELIKSEGCGFVGCATEYEIHGTILDGEFGGKKVTDFRKVSFSDKSYFGPSEPNEKFIKAVE